MNYEIKEPIFRVNKVSVKFEEKEVLKDISFEINNIIRPGMSQGQIVSLIGRSGIGKTVLFRILAGLSSPNSGEVLVGDSLRPVKSGDVGMVTQNCILFPHRTIKKNLLLANTDNELLKFYANEFDLTQHLNKYPHQLSGGQRQRASIVQQVMKGSMFILLDEPFSGLDCLMIDKVLNLLTKVSIQDEYRTLILVSHDLESCLSISDTAFVLNKPDPNQGAVVSKKYDLLKEGLCYQEGIKDMYRFKEIIQEIKQII